MTARVLQIHRRDPVWTEHQRLAEMAALPENLILKVVSEIHDPVTTTDELIPSGETSSYRSNPLGLAEFTLSRKDPAYVGRAKEVQVAQKAIRSRRNAGRSISGTETGIWKQSKNLTRM